MSPAYCFGCAFRLRRMGSVPIEPAAASEPLGACWDCGVFGCSEHAEREQGGYKWVCVSSVVKALSVASGLDEPEGPTGTDLRLEGRDDFETRLPRLAKATEEERRAWYGQEGELVEATSDSERQPYIDYGLLADAVGVGRFLVPGPREESAFFGLYDEETDESRDAVLFTVFPSRLAVLVRKLPDG